MVSKSKTLRIVVAFAMLLCCPIADAQYMVCGPNGCRMVSAAPVRSAVRSIAAPVVRVATAPVRVVRRGLFGRARYESVPQTTYSSGSTGGYSQSFGSSGGTATYETAPATSYGSSGGTGSYGDGPTDSRATAAPVTKAAPAATVPLSFGKLPDGLLLDEMSDAQLDAYLGVCDHGPDCLKNRIKAIAREMRERRSNDQAKSSCSCGPNCQCKTQLCTVPPAAPTKRLCIVPPTSVSATCRVPASGPSVEAVASL